MELLIEVVYCISKVPRVALLQSYGAGVAGSSQGGAGKISPGITKNAHWIMTRLINLKRQMPFYDNKNSTKDLFAKHVGCKDPVEDI